MHGDQTAPCQCTVVCILSFASLNSKSSTSRGRTHFPSTATNAKPPPNPVPSNGAIHMASYQYVYFMDGVSKTYPGGKKCFENIRLNFLPGVKIGVVGVNGAGKSTLMKIMAGHGQGFHRRGLGRRRGQSRLSAAGTRTGRDHDVRENVMLGVAEKGHARPLQRTGDELFATRPPTKWRSCRTRSTRRTCGTSTARSTSRWRRCAARPMTPMSTPVGR